ncbi:AAA family ATPase [Phocaeicola sp.]
MNKDEILKQTNGGLNVFRHYVPGNWRAGKTFYNPFYKDTHASFSIYRDKKTGDYRMKDFGNPDYSGDCFALVALLEGRRCSDKSDFVAVMDKISNDLNLAMNAGRTNAPVLTAIPACRPSAQTSPRRISATAERPLTAVELDWWAKFGITTEVLERYHVSAVSEIIFPQGRKRATELEPVFLYHFSGDKQSTRKLYAPCSKHRFMYLAKYENQYFGFEQLPSKGETVIVTGGEKDVMTLASMGLPALCLNSETAVPEESLLKVLKERFSHIVLMYDADETGIRCSSELCAQWEGKYPVSRVQLPLKGDKTEKDVSDYVRGRLAAGLGREAVAAQLHTWVEQVVFAKEDEALAPYLIRLSQPPVKPEAVLRVNHSTMAAAGGLVCITGGSGTGKSNYAAAILSGTLNTVMGEVDTLGVRVAPNVDQKAVLLFDTEQSEYQSYSNLDRLMHRAGVVSQPDYLQVMNLCPMPRGERQAFIEKALESAAHRHNGVYCAVVDGLADLIGSANDEEESVRIVEWAHRLAEKYHMVLMTIVHTAGMPEKVRGHLGSELTRKASAVVDIETDKRTGNSVVKMLKLREGSARDAGLSMFGWSERQGMHVSM